MAEQIDKKAPAKANGKKDGFGKKIARSFREIRSEMKKIVWPSKKQTMNNTAVVFVVMASVGAFIWIVDWVLTLIRSLILGA